MAGALEHSPVDRPRLPVPMAGANERSSRRDEGGNPVSASMENARTDAVELSDEQRERLLDLVRVGKRADFGRRQRARVLLLAEERHGDKAVAEILGVDRSTVWWVRKRFAPGGCEAALLENSRRGRKKFDADQRSWIVEQARSGPPEGFERWTLQLLAERLVEQGVVDAISLATVRLILMDDARRRGGRVWRCWK
jgi:transposase